MSVQARAASVAILVAAALAAGAGAAPVQVGPDVPAVSAAVVAIVVGDGLASGFVAEPGLVLTSLHVIGERSVVGVRLPQGSTAMGEVIWSSAESDLAVVRLPRGSGGGGLLDPARPDPGTGHDPVRVLFRSDTADGIVTRDVQLTVLGGAAGAGLLQPEPALGPEHLGAPVVDGAGRLVGVVARPGLGGGETGGPLVVAASRVRAEMVRAAAAASGPRAAPSGSGGAGKSPPATASRRSAARAPDAVQESDLDRERREGAEQFEREVARLAVLRDSAARTAARYTAECEDQYVPVLGGSPNWPYPGGLVAKSELPECRTLAERATAERERLGQRLDTAGDRARRAGVYPGTIRDILDRHGFDQRDLRR